MSKYATEDLCVEKLSEQHAEIIKTFQAFDKDLREFLKDDALKQQNLGLSVTYLWFEKSGGQLVGYITITNDAIKIEGNLAEQFNQLVRDKNITYKYLPAVKIGRMCVDDRYQHRGIGSLMVDSIVYLIINRLLDIVGCRFITLEAKDYSATRRFYKNYGFQILKERRKGPMPMYFDTFSVKEKFKKQ